MVRKTGARGRTLLTGHDRSDYVYMVPPFLAYYGVLTRNQSLVTEAYNQIRLYRQYLRDDDNLWKHIAMGGEVAEDNGHWTTGAFNRIDILSGGTNPALD